MLVVMVMSRGDEVADLDGIHYSHDTRALGV